ncbi:DNA-(apurinic or apyrimidinic site) endonuclease [Frankliniella fusca]|uniref:DNA-(apurinic or apyrimidinic site) endonuclease n=1 Tax=Frankliniella fusca TaxID=407009 RepID=A0AAE1LJQ2_9NEOP|nr:DNA-(apurinic or apyrimidinic site) endonuclease [Frankliniella fusca]
MRSVVVARPDEYPGWRVEGGQATGFSPHRLVFGEGWRGHGSMVPSVEEDTPIELGERKALLGKWQDKLKIQTEVIKRLEAAYEKNAKSYNLRRRPLELEVGQIVYRKIYTQSKAGDYYSSKLAPKYVGPFKICRKVGYKAYLLEDEKGVQDGPWHVSDLKPKAEVQSIELRTPLKICSWNVAGLKALVKKIGWDYFLKSGFQLVCLQETKCKESFLQDVPEVYSPFLLVGENTGYCGVLSLTTEQPVEVLYGLGDAELDREARVVTVKYNRFILVNVYVPFSGTRLEKLEKRRIWDSLFYLFIKGLVSQSIPLIICGDLNVAAQELDADSRALMQSELPCLTAGCTRIERAAFDTLLSLGLVDVFRHFNPNLEGAYTFWQYGGDFRSSNKGF